MNAQRRTLLKGMALGSITSFGLVGSGMGFAGESFGMQAKLKPNLIIVSDKSECSTFVQGIQTLNHLGSLQVQDTRLRTDFLLVLQRYIQESRGKYIIGLVDDANGTLIVDTARAAGARMYWLGHHTVDLNRSCHQLLISDAASGCITLLNHQHVTYGTDFQFSEQRLGAGVRSCQLAFSSTREGTGMNGEQWAASLGFVLADLGQSTPSAISRLDVKGKSLTGHFISFAFET